MADFPIHLGVLLRYIALLARGPYAYGSAANMIGSLRWFTRLLDPDSEKIFESVLVSVPLVVLLCLLTVKISFTPDRR